MPKCKLFLLLPCVALTWRYCLVAEFQLRVTSLLPSWTWNRLRCLCITGHTCKLQSPVVILIGKISFFLSNFGWPSVYISSSGFWKLNRKRVDDFLYSSGSLLRYKPRMILGLRDKIFAAAKICAGRTQCPLKLAVLTTKFGSLS